MQKRLLVCLFAIMPFSAVFGDAPSGRTDVGCYYGRVPTGVYCFAGYKFDKWFLNSNSQNEQSAKHWIVFGASLCDTLGRGFMFGLDMYGAVLSCPNTFDKASLRHKYLFSRLQICSMLKFGYCIPSLGLILYGGIGRNHLRGVADKSANINVRPQYLVWRFQVGGSVMISSAKVSVCYEFQKMAEVSCYSHGVMATFEWGLS